MKKIVLLFFFLGVSSFSQTMVTGYIYDKTTKEVLPYATIRLLETNYYSVTNEDGKFQFKVSEEINVDSLEVRFYGFIPKVVPISYFNQIKKLYLSPSVSVLDEIHLISNQKGLEKNKSKTFNLLYSVIKKYQRKKKKTESKAYLSLTSSSKNIPIEQIEGFFNCKQSLAEGIENLKLKSGRFGQSKSFSFYSINSTILLYDFHLFSMGHQILPYYPGNMSMSVLKKNYNVEVENCKVCNSSDIKIKFTPKKSNQKYFSGFIIFDKKQLIIKKIYLNIKNPHFSQLVSIVEKDIVTPMEVELKINFNPLDLNKIQSYNLKLMIDYKSNNSSTPITSNMFLYLYDYDNSFELPFYTNSIEFKNNYDQIIAQKASSEFWENNYQYPKSYRETIALNFMKKNGFLINYNNEIAVDYTKYINPSIVIWNKSKRLEWTNINGQVTQTLNYKNNFENQDIHIDTNSEVQDRNIEKTSFSYVLDFNEKLNGQKYYESQTIFNRAFSYYQGKESNNKLIYYNLVFDIFEYYRRNVQNSGLTNSSLKNIKSKFKRAFKRASSDVNRMRRETSSGENFRQLLIWNYKIKSLTSIDNYDLISKTNN